MAEKILKAWKILGGVFALAVVVCLVSGQAFAAEAVTVTDEAGLIAAVANGGEITLGDNITLTAGLVVDKDTVINTGDYQIGFTNLSNDDAAITVMGASLTINSQGSTSTNIGYAGTGNAIKAVGVADKETAIYLCDTRFYTSGVWYEDVEKFPKALFGVECSEGAAMPMIKLNGGGYSCAAVGYANNGALIEDNAEALVINAGTFYINPKEYLADTSISFEQNWGGEWNVIAIDAEYSDEFKSILNENNEIVINMYEPKPEEYTDIMFDALGEKYEWIEEGTPFKFYQGSHDRKNSTVCVSMLELGTGKVLESHVVKMVFNYNKDIKEEIDKMVAAFPQPEEGAYSYDFKISDMELVNYWMTCTPDNENLGGLLNYSGELKGYIGYKNIGMDARYGDDTCPLFTFAGGIVNFENNGIVYAAMDLGARGNHIFYVPDETKDTVVDMVAAAQKRIDDYVGRDKAKIEHIGTVSEFLESVQYEEELDIEGVALNDICVKITINEVPHYAVLKKGSKNMTVPSYKNVDMATDVEVDTEDSSVPLDTLIKVDKMLEGEEYERIMSALKVKDNDTYDIQLHSKTANKYIKKLDGGKFQVKLPISEKFKGKGLSVYYVDANGNVQVHKVAIEDGFAVFTTDHFSAYTLAEEHEHEYVDGKCACGEEIVVVPDEENPDEPLDEDENAEDELDDVPQTGDSAKVALMIMVAIMSATVIVKRYVRKNA